MRAPEHPNTVTAVENYAALLQATNRDLGIQIKLSTEPLGIFVGRVIAETPAAQAGMQPRDVIIRFNAYEVQDAQTLLRLVGATAIGTPVDVEIIRDGQRRTMPVTLGKRPVSRP